MPITAQKTKDIDPLTALKALLKEDLKALDRVIGDQLSSSVPLIPKVGQHLIHAGGKRLRPLLTIASYRLFNAEGDNVIDLAAAVEFIHNATLLHDDVVDESKLRRGVLSANEIWGNQASVLVGDFLLARSFQLMLTSNNPEVLSILADAAACISEGEILQLSLCHTFDISLKDSLRIIEAKTARLFAAACEVGALLAGHENHASALRNYGHNLGISFQIIDDILDYCANEDELGKEVGNDFKEGKITLPIILTYPHCTSEEKQFLKKTLIDHNQSPDDFSKLLQILRKYDGLKEAYDIAMQYGNHASQALHSIPEGNVKELLIELVNHCLKRQY
jgi:octaprenyl-diphosphate synthase